MTYCTTTFQKRVKRERNGLPFDTNWNHKEDVDPPRAKREFTDNATMMPTIIVSLRSTILVKRSSKQGTPTLTIWVPLTSGTHKDENKYDQVSELDIWRLVLTLSTYINYANGLQGVTQCFEILFFLIC